jgi:hypothetical protein
VADRAARALEGALVEFGGFDGAGRRPAEILAHMGDLFDWALSMASGRERWNQSQPLPWAEEQRFFVSLTAFDMYLASGDPQHAPIERLFQGPVADAAATGRQPYARGKLPYRCNRRGASGRGKAGGGEAVQVV